MRNLSRLLTAVSLMLTATCSQAQNITPTQDAVIPQEGDISALKQAFVESQLSAGFNQQQIDAFLNQAHYNQKVIDAITTPWEAKPWHLYQPIFLTEKRLAKGLEFWNAHSETITKAAKTFQVDPQIIVAIIGIETFYGGYMGNYPVIDALYTLGFHYTPRADFFRKELANLQLLANEEQLDINQLKGSYAGAMGYGQFIPSSYRHFAVDFDGDGKRDLVNNPVDAIGSVANYFHQHDWKQAEPVAIPLTAHQLPEGLNVWKSGKPEYKVADILSPEVSLAENIDLDISQEGLIVELVQAEQTDYWLGLHNFYVITRYNRSPLYAMAVYQFSQQLKDAYAKQ
ncbi:lytic murein transglycosylase B [Shewanella sp. Isolate11]|uniref:lytic murein transglycosylase B n=1 Tax=Shewanella sp. Isolate11 TaxID=2908530 RepID=UPI001EFCD5E4|nr:lytic murein transglycosylase B [Shewanella sp. Isolate11]MCG9697422.1 lytic murein transglycosylase B [Shewanella sp. Isolate11]